jgi:CysZ protein
MNFLSSILEAYSTFFKSISFTLKNFPWVLVYPFLFFILIILLSLYIEGSLYDYFSAKLFYLLSLENPDVFILKLLKFLVKGILYIFFKLIIFFFFFYFSGQIVLMLMTPVLSYASEKTEKILTNVSYTFSFKIFIRQVFRSLLLSFRNLSIQLLVMLLVVIITFIPILGWMIIPLSFIVVFIVNSYFLGFSFLDFSFERKNYSINQTVNIIRKNKGLAIGYGSIYYVFMMIPFLGNFLAPFVAVFCVVGSTISIEKSKLYD